MKVFNIQFSAQQIQVLNEFLQRVPLKGSEVPAYNSVMSAITGAKKGEVAPAKEESK